MKPLHVPTPLWESRPLSDLLGTRVFLKMEALQPVGSFKIRGIGRACQAGKDSGAERLIASSGGNAGYAVAYAGQRLGMQVTVYVPGSTREWMRAAIRREGATVIEHGESWDDSHAHALQVARKEGAAYIHPFDDPLLWSGHSTLIDEIAAKGIKPGLVVLSVGGGGLLCGVLEGLHRVGWTDVPVLAVETEGAASLAESVKAGRLMTLRAITSIATSLGARTVAAEAFAWTGRHPVTPWIVPDRAALGACFRFAEDHRILVEPACGAALSAVYDRADPLRARESVLIIVCGGAGVNFSLLEDWKHRILKR
ncbi:MAG: pyridoxal-phosphate dependent enzyme [Deltaproteobacteria bacterium]|nr:pyridoxal-phosphate dependent enzyme [Deltaproteobacteria bacterium]